MSVTAPGSVTFYEDELLEMEAAQLILVGVAPSELGVKMDSRMRALVLAMRNANIELENRLRRRKGKN